MEKEANLVFEKHTASVFCGSLNKSSKYAVTGGEDDVAYVWDVKTRETVFESVDHEDSVIFADFNHNDSLLATGDMSGILQVWNTNDKTLLWSFNMGDATWMHWHPKTNVIFAGSVDGEVYMWKIPSGECKVFQSNGHRAEVSTLLPDGKRMAVGYANGDIHIMDLSAGKAVHVISSHDSHKAAITCIDCHLNNNIIISAGIDGKTIISPVASHIGTVILQTLEGHENKEIKEESDIIDETEDMEVENKGNWIEAVAFQKDIDSQIAASGTVNGEIFIWDFANKVLRTTIQHGNGITKLTWKTNSWFLFAGGLDGILKSYDCRTGNCLQKFIGHSDNILDLQLSVDDKTLLTTSDDATARIFDINIP